MKETLPILDVSCLENQYTTVEEWKGDKFKSDVAVKALVKELSAGFGSWGFLYVKGHGIPQNLINQCFNVSESFFLNDPAFKNKFQRDSGISEGYVPMKGEVFDELKPEDIKEAFDFVPKSHMNKKLSQDLPEFVTNLHSLFEHCSLLLMKLLRLLAVALGIDAEHFVKLHENVGDRKCNGTSLRSLYYPPIITDTKEDQRRCSEHTDYGTVTMLFQDERGGLEVLSPSGEFVHATPIPGTIVINAADLLHSWSKGKFLATIHRVVIPTDCQILQKSRQSIAFFAHPDYDVTIKYSDENGIEKSRNAYEHLKERFASTIKVK